MAINALAIVERELAAGGADVDAHSARLAALGYADDAELAAAIRTGAEDDRCDEVRGAVAASVDAKLRVANPALPRGDLVTFQVPDHIRPLRDGSTAS